MSGARLLFSVGAENHGGDGPLRFAWHPTSAFLATVGPSRVVRIWDRYGSHIATVPPSPNAVSIDKLEWDAEGDYLAILQTGCGTVQLWSSLRQRATSIDTGEKALSFLSWSKTGPQLAIGSQKGNLYLYDKIANKTNKIAGKHGRKITCGAWNSDNRLALAGLDKTVSLSDAEGNNQCQITGLKSEPSDLQFNNQKTDGEDRAENSITLNAGGKTLYLCDISSQEAIDNPIELQFVPKYGDIVTYRWFGDGYILLGFSSGYVAAISTAMREIGEEIFHLDLLSKEVTGFAISVENHWTAVAGDNTVRLLNMRGLTFQPILNMNITLENGETSDQVAWTQDGNVLSVSTKEGSVHSYLMKVPCLSASFDSKVVHLASLRELSVVDTNNPKVRPVSIEVSSEPAFVALGPSCVAVGMNNRVWYYSLATSKLLKEREYHGTVIELKLSENYAAVLVEGQVMLHAIDPSFAAAQGSDGKGKEKFFPEKSDNKDVSCIAMTTDFLLYATKRGTLHYFYFKQWADVNEYQHLLNKSSTGVRTLYPNRLATRCVIVDAEHRAHVYNPVNDKTLEIVGFPSTVSKVMWDNADSGVMVAADRTHFYTVVYMSTGLKGAGVSICKTRTDLPADYTPITVYNGEVTCQAASGELVRVRLRSHARLDFRQCGHNLPQLRESLEQNLMLGRLKDCWAIAAKMNDTEAWEMLAEAAMHLLDIEMALRVYRQLGVAAMVLALQRLQSVEDAKLLAGHVALLKEDYSMAQDFFLGSTRPQTALEMRRDLLHWEQALKLARTLAPEEIPYISREYAQQLEFQTEYDLALREYSKALIERPEHDQYGMAARGSSRKLSLEEHNNMARAGIARMQLRLGDYHTGINMVVATNNVQLLKDCAQILEELRQDQDAAMLYERAECFDKAAQIHIAAKNFAQAAPLMASIKTPKLHLQFARAKEKDGAFVEAAAAYEKGKDLDSVVRLQLDQLRNPGAALKIVRETRSTESAKMVAAHCKKNGNVHGAIEFMLMAKQIDEAFEHATAYDAMDTFATCLGDDGTPEEYMKIAHYFESKTHSAEAARYYSKCHQYNKALRLFLLCGEREINAAIDVVGEARSEVLTNTLIDYLMGESDGRPKDPKFIFRLYMALGKYPEAVRTANVIAQQEQEIGNYKVAHDLLFDTFKDLEADKKRVPRELYRNLLLLHSYVLVKWLLPMGDHKTAARMLLRVAKNITKFPAHIVPILTSTVVECMKAGLKKSALEHAQTLMKTEYRAQVAEAYKRKIENMVRRRGKVAEEPDEESTPCPSCKAPVPCTELECKACQFSIPFCIVTGMHVVADDYTVCPSCRFDATHSAFVAFVNANKSCPMCNQEIVPSAIQKINDPTSLLRRNRVLDEGAEEEALAAAPKEGS